MLLYNKRRKVAFKIGTGKQHSEEYKREAVRLAKEIGNKAAAEELGIPKGTIGTWVSKAKAGEIDTGVGSTQVGRSSQT